jgi:hypothetical protein
LKNKIKIGDLGISITLDSSYPRAYSKAGTLFYQSKILKIYANILFEKKLT